MKGDEPTRVESEEHITYSYWCPNCSAEIVVPGYGEINERRKKEKSLASRLKEIVFKIGTHFFVGPCRLRLPKQMKEEKIKIPPISGKGRTGDEAFMNLDEEKLFLEKEEKMRDERPPTSSLGLTGDEPALLLGPPVSGPVAKEDKMSEWDLERFSSGFFDLACRCGIFRLLAKFKCAGLILKFVKAEKDSGPDEVEMKIGAYADNLGPVAFAGVLNEQRILDATKWLASRTEKDCCREAREISGYVVDEGVCDDTGMHISAVKTGYKAKFCADCGRALKEDE